MTNDFQIQEQRNALRRLSLSKRDAISEEKRHALSHTINESLRVELRKIAASYIHCYISFRSEVQTRDFIEEALADGARIVVPIVEELDGNSFLVHAEVSGLSNLRMGAFGLEEPVEQKPASLTGLDAVILPVAAFDQNGMRLGYGKGFYDRFLRELPSEVRRIGLAFECQRVSDIPRLKHDEGLDIVVTENSVLRFTRE